MLRFDVLAVMCLGLMVSCGPSELEGPDSEDSRGQQSSALSTISIRLPWTGSSGLYCLSCRNPPEYACSNHAADWQGGKNSFVDPVLSGDIVVGVTAKVYGHLVMGGVNSETISILLNEQSIGSYTEEKSSCRPYCDPPKQVSYSTAPNSVPSYVYGGTNTLTLRVPWAPTNSNYQYCVSHVDLYLTVAHRRIAVSSVDLRFGNQRIGTSSAAKAMVVRNTGDAPLQVTPSITGGPFILSSTGTFDLAPGQTYTLTVAFSPTAPGVATGTLILSSNDPTNPQMSVTLSGSGVKPILSSSATSLAFGEQRLYSTSASQPIRVTNIGTDTLQVANVSITGPFVLSPSASFTLPVGQSRELLVRFSPTLETVAEGKLTLTTDDPDRPTVTIPLSGIGVRPQLTLSTSQLSFGDQRVGSISAPQRVTVRNSGTGTLRITSLSVDKPFSVTPNVPLYLPTGASQELLVRFSPTASSLAPGTLSLHTSDPVNSFATVHLSGKGVSSFDAFPSGPLDFGTVGMEKNSSRTISLYLNRSIPQQRLVVKLRDSEGTPFSVEELAALTESLSQQGHATLTVTFQPKWVGEARNEVEVWLQGDTEPEVLRIPVTGTGQLQMEAGGCSSSGGTEAGTGMLALFALVGLGSRWWRRGSPSALMGLLLALLLPLSVRAESSAEVQTFLVSINSLHEELEYERALEQVSRAKRVARGVEDEVILSLYEGILLAELGRNEESTAAFKSALFLEPEAKLPKLVSPKVEKQFEATREQVKKAMAPILAKREEERREAEARQQQLLPKEEPPQPQPSQETQVSTVPPAPVPSPGPDEDAPRADLRSRALLPAIAGGVLLAAGGVSFGLSKAEQTKLRNRDPSLGTFQAANDSATRGKVYQTVGLSLLGVGVVGLGIATGLYVLGAPTESFSLGVTTDGTSAFVYGRWP